MRRPLFALVVIASACSVLVACGGDESSSPVSSRAPKTNDADQPGAVDPNATTPASAGSCTGVADAKQISIDARAADLQLVDGAVFFRAGTKVIRAAKDGSGEVTVYESPALVRSHFTGGLIITIEDPEPPNAIVKVSTVDDPNNAAPDDKFLLDGATIPTNWNAGGSYFIGSDPEAIYAVGDEQTGEVIYKIPRTAPVLEALATVTDGLSSVQVAGGDVWYVRDRSRVYQIPLAVLDPNNPELKVRGEPKEIFGSTANACALAVGQDAAFCSAGAFVERRDLSGGNPQTLLEANKSKVAAPFGGAVWFDGTLYVRTSAPDATMGHALRALKASPSGVEEKIVACGRSAIGEVAVDKDMVVWTEPGKGVFSAPR